MGLTMKQTNDKLHYKLKKPLKRISDYFLNIKKIRPVLKINCMGENCKHEIIYKPDFCFAHNPTKTSEELIVFEIIDKQGTAKTVSDILRMKFLKNCRKGFFICDNEKKTEMVEDALCVTLSRLEKWLGVKGKRNVVDIDIIQIEPDAKCDDIFKSLIFDMDKVIKLKMIPTITGFFFKRKNGRGYDSFPPKQKREGRTRKETKPM